MKIAVNSNPTKDGKELMDDTLQISGNKAKITSSSIDQLDGMEDGDALQMVENHKLSPRRLSPRRGDMSEDEVQTQVPVFNCQITSNIMKTHHVLIGGKSDRLEKEMVSTVTMG